MDNINIIELILNTDKLDTDQKTDIIKEIVRSGVNNGYQPWYIPYYPYTDNPITYTTSNSSDITTPDKFKVYAT